MNLGRKPTIIALAKHKGGVGCSTLCWALASVWAERLKLLVFDFDPQSTVTVALCDPCATSGYDLLSGRALANDVITNALPEYSPSLKIIPASSLLARLDVETAARFDRAHLVADALDSIREFDIVLMDCPPSQGSILSIGPLAAADYAILPCSCDDASFQQVSRFKQTLEMVQKRLRPELQWLPIAANLYDHRQIMDRQVLKSLRDNYRVFQSVVPKRILIREQMANRTPCTNPELRELASEILEELK